MTISEAINVAIDDRKSRKENFYHYVLPQNLSFRILCCYNSSTETICWSIEIHNIHPCTPCKAKHTGMLCHRKYIPYLAKTVLSMVQHPLLSTSTHTLDKMTTFPRTRYSRITS